jgi:hypothetical protein
MHLPQVCLGRLLSSDGQYISRAAYAHRDECQVWHSHRNDTWGAPSTGVSAQCDGTSSPAVLCAQWRQHQRRLAERYSPPFHMAVYIMQSSHALLAAELLTLPMDTMQLQSQIVPLLCSCPSCSFSTAMTVCEVYTTPALLQAPARPPSSTATTPHITAMYSIC